MYNTIPVIIGEKRNRNSFTPPVSCPVILFALTLYAFWFCVLKYKNSHGIANSNILPMKRNSISSQLINIEIAHNKPVSINIVRITITIFFNKILLFYYNGSFVKDCIFRHFYAKSCNKYIISVSESSVF